MNLKLQKFLKYWLPVFVYLVIIFLFSDHPSVTVTTIDWGDFIFKKTVHFFEYAFLALLFYRALKSAYTINDKILVLALIFSILYAISDEFHQSFIPGRTATLRDVIIDTAGASSALIYLWKYLPKAPKKLKSWAKKLEID